MRKVLITGGAGFIGSHLADHLRDNKYHITILDNLSPKVHFGVWPKYLDANYKLIYGDVTNREDLKAALKGIDVVFHLAAEMDLNPDYYRFINNNVGSTALLYEVIQELNYRNIEIIIASTQFVYGEGRWINSFGENFYPERRVINEKYHWDVYKNEELLTYQNCLEDQQLSPPNHYAISKYFQERFAISIGKLNNISTKILRFSIIHGPRQSIKNTYSGALRTFCYMASLDMKFSTFEDNLSMRDFTPIYDAVKACRLVLEKGKDFEIYNISNGRAITVKKLAKIVSGAFGKKLVFNDEIEYRHGDIRHAISDIKKIVDLGFTPEYNEEDVVKEYVSWFKIQNLDFERFLKTQEQMRLNGQIRRK